MVVSLITVYRAIRNGSVGHVYVDNRTLAFGCWRLYELSNSTARYGDWVRRR